MKIGLSTWSFPWALSSGEPLASVAERAVRMGAEVFQIADNCVFYEMCETERENIMRIFADGGVEVEFGAAELSEEVLEPIIKLCGRYGVRFVRTLPHLRGGRMEYSQAVRALQKLEPLLRERGIVLGIENHDFYPAVWLGRLAREISSPYVGICLDAVNNLGQGESFREVFTALADYTVNFHCKDYTIRRRKNKLGFIVSGCACGEGMLDFSLAATRFGGLSWIVELWTDKQENIRDTVALESRRAAESILFLRNFRVRRGLQ